MLLAVMLMVGAVSAGPGEDGAGSRAPDAAAPVPFAAVQLAQAAAAADPDRPARMPGAESFAVVQGYGDATDRLAKDIGTRAAKQKVLLVWVLDQSESMEDDREEITTRIERIYQEYGAASGQPAGDLSTGVVSYGEKTLNHTPKPTSKPQEIMAAIKAVPNDATGHEMQCDAIEFAIETFRPAAEAANRQLMLVLVTDESGDINTNITKLETTIAKAKEAKCGVHVLGREAIFGYPYAHMSWTHKETRTTHWLRIDRGPETAQPEQLQINGFHRRNDAFPSGFGPYDQSRLAKQTGGVFYLLPSPEVRLVGRDTRLFDSEALRPYAPDLSSRADYMAERDKNPLRKAVFKVITDLNPFQQGSKMSRCEVSTGPFPIDREQFAAAASVQVKKSEELIRILQQAQLELEEVAADRAREQSPRWRANYDLIYAQVISYQARLEEYGWYLAEFTKNPKVVKNILGPVRPTNGWYVGVIPRLLKPDVTQAQRDKADLMFREIQKEYRGTPWGDRAKDEINRGYGIELREGHDDVRGRAGIAVPKF